jgi:hypothetical protein
VRIVVLVQRQTDLLEPVHALSSSGSLASILHGRQQQRRQHRNDRDDDQQFDQSESSAMFRGPHSDFSRRFVSVTKD